VAARTDPLAEYNAKRDFKKTAEPAGKSARSDNGNLFIVQKHAATRLHWDFRIEVDGVMKSWAVTKGPSPDPDDKRLAVRTEDHPLSYAEFEGAIPKGEYGGGTVMLWDKGTWAPVPGKSAKDIAEGHLHFTLQGERMKGDWMLIRLKPRAGEKRENWLLRKVRDEFAQEGDQLVEHALTSVLTGRSMAEIEADKQGEFALAGKKGKAFAAQMDAAADHNAAKAKPALKLQTRPRAKRKAGGKPPAFRAPQLATLVDAVPTGNQWMHEIKFDGYRALIAAAGDTVVVYTRNGHDWSDKFKPLVTALSALDLPPCLIDGEIVAYGKDGNPDFSSLQSVLKRGHGSQTDSDLLELFAFDLLELDGEDLGGLPNIERKERLEALLAEAQAPIHVADHVIGAGEKLFKAMCAASQEGIIAKKIDATYHGKRSQNWVKVKCINRQEFVVVGWSKSTTKQRPFGSLLLAQYEGAKAKGDLVYKGKVGTGFNGDALAQIADRLGKLVVAKAPLDVPRVEARGATWVKPTLVAEVAFAEFTGEGRVRHASFLGLRADKKARQVTPEKAAKAPPPAASVAISNPDRVIFPESGQTKGALAAYYEQVAPLMLPFAGNRPISLVRCPQGRDKKCFFQKHDSGTFGTNVHQVPILEKDGGSEDYLYVNNVAGLLQCVQMGTIEFHGWGARADAVERPDRMIFDLDPDEGLDFADVKSAAIDIRDRLADMGLTTYAMLSGGKGVHVVVPLKPGHDWDTHKDFSRRFAEALAQAEPDRFIATMSKAKRKGKIFIDWLRNQRGATAVVPFSARARANAPVAVPIAWDELAGFDHANGFTIADGPELIERATGKRLAGWGFADQELPDL
jgi:bifunctional non-homologous end joining protein LigD